MAKRAIKKGDTFRYHYADSNPLWQVVKARGKGCWECVVTEESADWEGVVKVFSSEEILKSRNFSNFWQELADEHERWAKANLKVGQFVHFSHGHDSYIRSEVVGYGEHVTCKPIAMVGKWREHDLPSRSNNGSIYLPYLPASIVKGDTHSINSSNLYEYQKAKGSLKPEALDPTNLPAIDLSVPDMTPEEEYQASLWRRIESIRKLIDEVRKNPAECLNAIRVIATQV